MSTATVSAKGQVVIPVEIRRKLGIGPGSELEFEEHGGTLRVRVIRAVAPRTVDEGYGMLKYSGELRRLAQFDVAAAMRAEKPKP